LEQIKKNEGNELIWVLEHEEIYTGGTSFNNNEILDKSINFIKTNRGGKITYHGPGQIVFYFVLDLNKRGKNIKKLLTAIEKTIIDTLKDYNINSFADRENIGIWFKDKSGEVSKIAAIGIKVKKWIAYHGFAINISNNLDAYKKIIPCGINNKGVTNLTKIKKQSYKKIKSTLIKNFLSNIKN
jgi:lipoyl(octanoyl) transferase